MDNTYFILVIGSTVLLGLALYLVLLTFARNWFMDFYMSKYKAEVMFPYIFRTNNKKFSFEVLRLKFEKEGKKSTESKISSEASLRWVLMQVIVFLITAIVVAGVFYYMFMRM